MLTQAVRAVRALIRGAHAGRDLITSAVMLIFGAVEIAFGLTLANPAVTADGGHSATDAICTLVTAVVKLTTGRHPSHWVKVHFPAKTGIWICRFTIGSITILTLVQIALPVRVTVGSAITTAVLGIVGASVRLPLSVYMRRGGTPQDAANAGHLLTDAWSSVLLAACGFAVLWCNQWKPGLGPWVFRGGAVVILVLVWIANIHIINHIRAELDDCNCTEEQQQG